MFLGFISVIMLLVATVLFWYPKISTKDEYGESNQFLKYVKYGIQAVLIVLGLFILASRSFVIIDANEVGYFKRIYFASDLPAGNIIATKGEKGPQADILGPGFHWIPMLKILNTVEEGPVAEIPEGKYGMLVAKDGLPLEDKQFIAGKWPEGKFNNMLDANYFLMEGKGQKGPQLDVLRPGKYRINGYLFDVKLGTALDVPTGHVAVIRSNVQTAENCLVVDSGGRTGEEVATPIVKKGCIGVWDEPLLPGRYYLNKKAYVATIIPTRLQTWTYKGDYTKRQIDLRVGDNGQITQTETSKMIEVPKNAAASAIKVRVEGWTIPVEMRVVVQVHPENAPIVVATIGNLQKIEDNIITPAIRDILRSIGGKKGREAMDFMTKRDEITKLVETAIAKEGVKAGVSIQEVRMGEPAIPPELLVATLREQLATQLKQTYIKEKAAQKQRIKVERERATANQQKTLVKAEIAKAAAAFTKDKLKLEGEGEKLKLIEIAKGQEAQANVLGKDRAMQLQALEKSLAAAVANPDIVKVPMVNVESGGGSGSYEGAAAVLGSSNLIQMMKGIETTAKPKK